MKITFTCYRKWWNRKSPFYNICCHFTYVFITTIEQQFLCLGKGMTMSWKYSSEPLSPLLSLRTPSLRTPQAEWRDVVYPLFSTGMAVLLLSSIGFVNANLCFIFSSFFLCWGKISSCKKAWRVFSGICYIWFPGGVRLHKLHPNVPCSWKYLGTQTEVSAMWISLDYSPQHENVRYSYQGLKKELIRKYYLLTIQISLNKKVGL